MNTGNIHAVQGRDKMITIVALCGIQVSRESIRVDRKFHTGMLEYAKRMERPVACLLPQMTAQEVSRLIDVIEVPVHQAPYRIYTVANTRLSGGDISVLEQVVDNSALVYCGPSGALNWAIVELCLARRVPYVVTTEYTLRTQLDIMRAITRSMLRRIWRGAKIRIAYNKERALVAAAAQVHANGYPTYFEHAQTNPERLMFFDSRITSNDLIREQEIRHRVAALRDGKRIPRLIYSGRYHPVKGTLDVVKAGVALLRYQRDFRLDLFGNGPLEKDMCDYVRSHNAERHIFVNPPVPFSPDLLEITRQCDLFLCCHIQGDPSCTYLETFASGVPIVGYNNEMWLPLSEQSHGGITVRKKDYSTMARIAASLLCDYGSLLEYSLRARQFAADNTMSKSWDKRCEGLEMAIAYGAHA